MSAFDHLDRALALLRSRAGLKQMQVAKQAGITPSMISEYESGKKRPHVDTLDKILDVLDVDAHLLANALRDARREAAGQSLRDSPAGDRVTDPGTRARLRATAALGEMTTAFDTLTRSIEDLLLAAARSPGEEGSR
jgi:transcriptional regulator with XRE-family HTH domain